MIEAAHKHVFAEGVCLLCPARWNPDAALAAEARTVVDLARRSLKERLINREITDLVVVLSELRTRVANRPLNTQGAHGLHCALHLGAFAAQVLAGILGALELNEQCRLACWYTKYDRTAAVTTLRRHLDLIDQHACARLAELGQAVQS